MDKPIVRETTSARREPGRGKKAGASRSPPGVAQAREFVRAIGRPRSRGLAALGAQAPPATADGPRGNCRRHECQRPSRQDRRAPASSRAVTSARFARYRLQRPW
jgi:hypothetical protein